MDKVFVIPDIHGKKAKLDKLLTKWNPDNQQLILLGDMIDRGEDSYGVLHLAQQLQKKYGAVIIQGNHEEMFLTWLDAPLKVFEWYFPQGGRETIYSFFDRYMTDYHMPDYIANLLKTQFSNEIEFLKSLPSYYEWNNYIFVHAGVNLFLKDWKNTKPDDFRWIREPFIFGKNETGKTIVFGHTRTALLNKDSSSDVWISPCKTKIGLDGGAFYGGFLHGLLIDNEGYTIYSVDNALTFTNEKAS